MRYPELLKKRGTVRVTSFKHIDTSDYPMQSNDGKYSLPAALVHEARAAMMDVVDAGLREHPNLANAIHEGEKTVGTLAIDQQAFSARSKITSRWSRFGCPPVLYLDPEGGEEVEP